MKAFVWFTAGTIFGVVSLLIVLAWKKPNVSFDDLKIAAASPESSWLTPTPSATRLPTPTPGAVQVSGKKVVRVENGQFTHTTEAMAPGTRAVQAARTTQHAPAPQTSQPIAAAAPPAAKPKGEEVSVFLDRQQLISTRSGSYQIFVHDHGSETISVSVGYGPYTRMKKAMGTDSVGDNKALIYSDGRVQLFHVNSPRAPQNCCLIEVVRAA